MRKLFVFAMITATLLLAPTVPSAYPTTAALNILWRVKMPGNDFATTPFAGDLDTFASDGAIYYIPKTNIANTAPFYRLLNPSIPDHMDSFTAGENGYSTEFVLGYGFTGSAVSSGIAQIYRYRKGTNDRAIGRPDEAQYFSSLGYSLETAQPGWAFPRYGKIAEALLTLSAGGVTISSNAVAGGALWKWTWNGTQFLNYADYGREIQSSLSYLDAASAVHLPTEAGDIYSSVGTPVERRHGSPLLSFSNSGNTQTTRGVPLEWNPSIAGGDGYHPVIYDNMRELGKNITLNYNNLGAVARYDTRWYMPTPMSSVQIEIPTGYLRASFNRFFTYDAAADHLEPQTVQQSCPPTSGLAFSTNYGGVILSDASGLYAMGVYGKSPAVGGPVSYFTLWNFICNDNGGTGATDDNTTKLSAVYGPANYSTVGYYQTTTWVASGTLSDVRQKMRGLYLTPPTQPDQIVAPPKEENLIRIGNDEPGWDGNPEVSATRTWIVHQPANQTFNGDNATK